MNSFRDFEKSLCILWDRACINILDPDQVSGANGILCYGYVDHAAGLTFEGLALVSCMDDDYTIVLDNDEIGMKIRADEEKVRNAVPVSNKALLARYADRIEILDIYYEDTEVVCDKEVKIRHPTSPRSSLASSSSSIRRKLEKEAGGVRGKAPTRRKQPRTERHLPRRAARPPQRRVSFLLWTSITASLI